MIELDSSTSAKFSRHIILRIPEHAFANNLHVGMFIQFILQAAGSPGSNGPCSNLWVNKVTSVFTFRAIRGPNLESHQTRVPVLNDQGSVLQSNVFLFALLLTDL